MAEKKSGLSVLEINQIIVTELRRKKLIEEKTLNIYFEQCQRSQQNLGQVLVQRRLLNMTNFVSIMREITNISQSNLQVLMQGNTPSRDSTQRISETRDSEEKTEPSSAQLPGLNTKNFAGYEILNEIARGGMGVVYRAKQHGTNRIVALKVLLHTQSEILVQRFFREAEATAKLKHPNIIPIYSTGEQNKYYYFTMKYITGGTFKDVMEKNIPLSHKLQIFEKMCYALQLAHDNKILHRDLKPSNILIDENGEPYLTDFGLAKFMDHRSALTQTGSTVGTPSYMSPEQVEGDKKKIGPASDLYSMGAMLYEILTGTLPFIADTINELYRKIKEEDPIPPTEINPDIPPILGEICLKALEKTPTDRYASMKDLAKDLESFRLGQEIHIKKSRVKSKLSRWKRKHHATLQRGIGWYLPIVACVVLISYLVYYFINKHHFDQAQQRIQIENICQEALIISGKNSYGDAVKFLQNKIEEIGDSSRLYTELAKLHQNLEDWSAAQIAIEKAINLEPENWELSYFKANILMQQQQYSLALETLSSYISKDPPSKISRLQATILQKLGKSYEAQIFFRQARETEKIEIQESLKQLETPEVKVSLEARLAVWEQVLATNPWCELAYIERSKILVELGKITQSLNDIARALELNPTLEYFLLQNEILEKAGYLNQARQNWLKLFQQFPSLMDPNNVFKLAEVELKLGNYTDAFPRYKNIYALSRQENVALRLARCAFYLKQYEDCQQYLDQIRQLKTESELAEIAYYRGYLFIQKQKYEEGLQELQKSLSLKSNKSGEIYRLQGEIYTQKKMYSFAISSFQKAVEIFPNEPQLWEMLAKVAIEEKDYKLAISAWTHCIQLDPWVSQYYLMRGRNYSEIGHFEEAERDFLKCLEITPEDLEPLLDLCMNMFSRQFLVKFNDLKMIVAFFDYQNEAPIELFIKEEKELFSRYTQEYLQHKISQNISSTWDEKQAQLLLKGFVESESAAVHEMATNGLLTMAKDLKLQEMLQVEISKKHSAKVKKRLDKLFEQIRQEYLNEYKIYMKHWLSRFYGSHDRNALTTIYQQDKLAISCLDSIIQDEQEPYLLRFLAARMLIDLRSNDGLSLLQKYIQKPSNNIAALFAYIVLMQQKYNLPPLPFLNTLTNHPEPFIRSLLAKHLPLEVYKNIFQQFLKDVDAKVRLISAERLYLNGDISVQPILYELFQHQDFSIRRAAISIYWNMRVLKKNLKNNDTTYNTIYEQALKNLSTLKEAIYDASPQVRRIAIIRMEELALDELDLIIEKGLDDKDKMVRLQSVISLTARFKMDKVMPMVKNPEEPLLFRLSAFLGGQKSFNKENVTEWINFAIPMMKEKDYRIRIIIFLILGRSEQKTVLNLISQYLKSREPKIRMSALLGLMGSNRQDVISHFIKMLKDPDFEVRFTAAASYTSVAAYYNTKQVSEICKQLKDSNDPVLTEGGAMGFNKIIYDCVPYRPTKEVQWDWYRSYAGFAEEIVKTITESDNKIVRRMMPSKSTEPPKTLNDLILFMNAAVDLSPKVAQYWFERGVLYTIDDRHKEAIQDFQKALELNPSFHLFKFWLAKSYYKTKQYQNGLENIEQYIQEFPWESDAYTLYAQILQEFARHDEAKAAYTRAELLRKLKPSSNL